MCGGRPKAQVAEDLGISRETVSKWRARFVADRLDGLVDKPRTDAPRKVTDEQVEPLVAHTLGRKPPCGDRSGVELERDIRSWINEWN
ncbi:helix-turn-helix domain-containing protein [Streptomyces sp. NPDC047079]|uniref:helix-turn-helix domain-containing protein n=1 Tax=Streptomyces sp. NPDC047079 TaxID=3154607 RepID=UPI0033E4DBFC